MQKLTVTKIPLWSLSCSGLSSAWTSSCKHMSYTTYTSNQLMPIQSMICMNDTWANTFPIHVQFSTASQSSSCGERYVLFKNSTHCWIMKSTQCNKGIPSTCWLIYYTSYQSGTYISHISVNVNIHTWGYLRVHTGCFSLLKYASNI